MLAIGGFVIATTALDAQPSGARAAQRGEERAILAELVSINSSTGTPGVDRIGLAVTRRLRAAGFAAADVQRLGPGPALMAVVARYRGKASGRKPILLMAHMDVVTALPSDWTRPPFTFGESDGCVRPRRRGQQGGPGGDRRHLRALEAGGMGA
ncbi:MAG: hypothetical protein U5K74_13835 [Gemmatimonadaceae bacterium]|nr:hypothetical protein [Gemmatimonadaceae bacterium]